MRVLLAADREVRALGFSPDGRTLVAGYERRGAFAWDLATGGPPVHLAATTEFPQPDLFFSPDGRIVSWRFQARRHTAEVATGRTILPSPPADRPLLWFAQSPDGERVYYAHGREALAVLTAWRHEPGGWVREWAVTPAEQLTLSFALDPTGRRLVHLAEKPDPRWPEYDRLVVRDLDTGEEVGYGRFPYAEAGRNRLVFRPDGHQVVGLHEMTLLVWAIPVVDKDDPRLVRNDSRKHFTAAAYHPSGRHLFTTSNDTTVVLWDTRMWTPTTRFTWAIGRLKSVAVSPDGSLAAAGSDDGRVVVWDVDV